MDQRRDKVKYDFRSCEWKPYSRVLYSKGLMARGSNCPILIPHHSGRP